MKYWIGKIWLTLFRWRLEGETKLPAKFVFIAAPHTSNWDLPHMLATAYVLQVRISWLGKHTLFTGFLGRILEALGGIPIDRRTPKNMVDQIANQFNRASNLILAVPPEGTRGKTEYWKSGFYHIALRAGVPIGFGFLDYGRRCCGIGGFLNPTGDIRGDMGKIRDFYTNMTGKYPDLQGRPRLREEDDPPEGPA
ncbi:MAG: lysophospholipid acyltransferase family protein [Deltaproteobacteria bacterium]|nr:lysophospholipid acyltransferase family protein [Deltaproteobacteria bacterium]